jgi:hypothetical protein
LSERDEGVEERGGRVSGEPSEREGKKADKYLPKLNTLKLFFLVSPFASVFAAAGRAQCAPAAKMGEMSAGRRQDNKWWRLLFT